MFYLYLCICTNAKCMSVELKVYLFIWSHNFRFSMSLSLSPNSLYRQTTDCTEGGGLTREHCMFKDWCYHKPHHNVRWSPLIVFLITNQFSIVFSLGNLVTTDILLILSTTVWIILLVIKFCYLKRQKYL